MDLTIGLISQIAIAHQFCLTSGKYLVPLYLDGENHQPLRL
ncbi:hypothetical protein [Fischerella sp. JS2]|nr:hypothetical protein [Fischerella sp. JS2]